MYLGELRIQLVGATADAANHLVEVVASQACPSDLINNSLHVMLRRVDVRGPSIEDGADRLLSTAFHEVFAPEVELPNIWVLEYRCE
jgi:hypothetical protein